MKLHYLTPFISIAQVQLDWHKNQYKLCLTVFANHAFFLLKTVFLLSLLSFLAACHSSIEAELDTTAPVITLNGANPLNHNYGDSYTDLGATALDNVDGSVAVTMSGDLNIDMINTYTLTYSASDAAGNASSITRTVNVIDMAGPVLTLNGASTLILGKGRDYIELGATALDRFDGEIVVAPPIGAIDNTRIGTYQLTYQASDTAGNSSLLQRTVNVIAPRPFIITWKTDNASEKIVIPTNGFYSYDYSVDWGDSTTEVNIMNDASHIYATAGTYTLTINGIFPQIYFRGGTSDSGKIMSVEQWGDITLLSMESAFWGCSNLVSNALDTPDLRQVTDSSYMFYGASVFNADISAWDVSAVTTMEGAFADART
ncbi:immunoglobulin-like domain-containing protein, partial [Psychromonas hadalis]|uniref:immunoglobulin-like domain-containing protein n=1 Tax=Psychromonas hadalis TaxID=211669 RepID=UPI000527F4C9